MSGTLPISSFYSYLSITFWPTNYCPWWAYKILEKRLHITRSKRQKDNISWWISFTFALFTKVMKVLTPIIIDWGWFVLNIWKSGKKNFVFVSSSSFGLCILLLRTFRYTGKHVCLTFKDLYFSFFLWILVRCLSHIFKQKTCKSYLELFTNHIWCLRANH